MRKGQSQVVKNKSDHACMSRCVSDDLASEATEKNEVFRGALPGGRKRAARKTKFFEVLCPEGDKIGRSPDMIYHKE